MEQNSNFLRKRLLLLVLCLLVLLFLIQRGGLILFGYSHVAHPYFDESVSGVLPCDILDGTIRTFPFAYEYLNRSGDVLVEGLLLVPYFKLLGRSIFSTKIFALTSSLLVLMLWILFIKKYQGIAAAIIFSALYALPPLTFARLNLIGTISSHHMISSLIALQSILLFKLLEARNGQNVPAWLWFVFGTVAGFGVYTFYTYIIFLGFCLLVFLLFKPLPLQPLRVLILAIGFAAGFSPWILRFLVSHAGSSFLSSMIKSMSIDLWNFIQNLCFAVPHSFGYNYPSRSVGFISIALSLFILFCIGIIIKNCLFVCLKKNSPLYLSIKSVPLAHMQGLFCALFPLLFIVCLSLSPMRITPFEYWQTIGLFFSFGESDVIRYRWLYILYPFYFAAVAIGTAIVFNLHGKHNLYKMSFIAIIVFFAGCGLWKSFSLCTTTDFGKIFSYTGYNYDQFAPKFILGDFAPRAKADIESIVINYPETYRNEAYRSFGTFIAAKVLDAADPISAFENELVKIPGPYVNDFIYGVVRLAQGTPAQKLQSLSACLIQKYPHVFYKNLGFRYLGYKYYLTLVNEAVLLANIPAAEQWFYRKNLEALRQEIHTQSSDNNWPALLEEINKIPRQYQGDAVKGLGMLVGAEMLFDPLHHPDYPLDSSFGSVLRTPLKEAFYQGIGMGFAETLCRYWRRLMPPDTEQLTRYFQGLEIEWQRCTSLMTKMPQNIFSEIIKGFKEELHGRSLNPYIHTFIQQHQDKI